VSPLKPENVDHRQSEIAGGSQGHVEAIRCLLIDAFPDGPLSSGSRGTNDLKVINEGTGERVEEKIRQLTKQLLPSRTILSQNNTCLPIDKQ
jgi:hypothetical protein